MVSRLPLNSLQSRFLPQPQLVLQTRDSIFAFLKHQESSKTACGSHTAALCEPVSLASSEAVKFRSSGLLV